MAATAAAATSAARWAIGPRIAQHEAAEAEAEAEAEAARAQGEAEAASEEGAEAAYAEEEAVTDGRIQPVLTPGLTALIGC